MQMTSPGIIQTTPSSKSKSIRVPLIFMQTLNENDKIYQELKNALKRLNVKIISDKNLFQEANMVILFNKDKNLLKKAWEHGVIPITQKFLPQIEDYNPNTEKGNSFVYKELNKWDIFAAVVRAVETFKFPYDWKFIIRSCKKA
jgi:hypothetical protein